MTADQYWRDDCTLVRAYRQAYELTLERENRNLWLQGMYFQDALGSVMSAMFSKKGRKPAQYPEMPYPITRRMQEEAELEKTRKQAAEIRAFAEKFNETLLKKEGGE